VRLSKEDKQQNKWMMRVGITDNGEPEISLSRAAFSNKYLTELCDLDRHTTFQEVKNKLRWGTYGVDGVNDLKWVKLVDCDSNHLQMILNTQFLNDITSKVIKSILNDRVRPIGGI